jgi:hypothetical protein
VLGSSLDWPLGLGQARPRCDSWALDADALMGVPVSGAHFRFIGHLHALGPHVFEWPGSGGRPEGVGGLLKHGAAYSVETPSRMPPAAQLALERMGVKLIRK